MANRRTLRRSLELLRAFRLEQSDPDRFYDLIAGDAVTLVGDRVRLQDALVLDVGAGAGYFTKAFRKAGAHCFVVEPSISELSWRGARPQGAVMGDGYQLPFRSGAADLVVSSNVLEHVAHPYVMLDELARVARVGGHVWMCFTNWYSPWGGHETSPWHYFGAERALRRYESHYGRPVKNRIGEGLFKVHVGRTLSYAKSTPLFDLVEAIPRYYPAFARGIVHLPGIREVATWNLELLLRRTSVGARPAEHMGVDGGAVPAGTADER